MVDCNKLVVGVGGVNLNLVFECLYNSLFGFIFSLMKGVDMSFGYYYICKNGEVVFGDV